MYEILKAVHIIAVVTTIASMVALSLVLRGAGAEAGAIAIQRTVLSWDRRVGAPALGLAWIAGFTLAADAGYLASPWLWLKLVLVVALSALHGVQGGNLRRQLDGRASAWPWAARQPVLVLAIAAAIIALVVIKPFG